MTGQVNGFPECYFCGDKLPTCHWCKLCQKAFCIADHIDHEMTMRESEYLSWHQYYDMEFLGVKH